MHEAGHAVASLALGGRVIKATIVRGADYDGQVQYDRERADGTLDGRRAIVVGLAGGVSNQLAGEDAAAVWCVGRADAANVSLGLRSELRGVRGRGY